MENISRLFDILIRQKESFQLKNSLCAKKDGAWLEISTDEFYATACRVSYALWATGIKEGDRIAIISNNRPEWNMLDMGMLQCGIVNVPMYLTLSAAESQFILNDCGAKLVFVSDQLLAEKVSSIKAEVSTLTEIITFDKVPGYPAWEDFLNRGKDHEDEAKLHSVRSSVKPKSLATLIYTSGTTGNPKGVMLSHDNLISNVLATRTLPPVSYRAKALSFLPLCHVYERMLTYLYMFLGISIYYAESMEKIGDNLKEVKPDVFSTVPRLLEKVYDKIVAKGAELTGVKKKLFFWALDLGLKYELDGANGLWYEIQLAVANKIIFNKWRDALGGNVKVIVSGGAALQPRLARVFFAARIPVLEGYGLTETSPVVAVNNTMQKNAVRFGTVGPVIEKVQVKIADDGEILCKGPNIMLGYYNRKDLTEQVIDEQGWFHTGDIGVLENGRFLKITDRKKEIFKTSGGKYIAPQALENKFKESLFIEQVMIVGENQKFAAALVVPSFAHLKAWCESNNIPVTSNEELVVNPEVVNRYQQEIDNYNRNFGQTEQVKKFKLLPSEWSVDSGDLTPTLKLKRKIIAGRNSKLIEAIYTA